MTQKFIDLQINGYAGIDFNQDHLTEKSLFTACELLQEHRVKSILATIITAPVDSMVTRIKNIVKICQSNSFIRSMIGGLHLEGPFISDEPGYVGAHPRHAVKPANLPDMELMLAAGEKMVKLVTLAPEQDEKQIVTKYLSNKNIIVAAGHTNASLDTLKGAIDAGLTMFTHLGNGCPLMMHRHDNIIQRALHYSSDLWFSLIADGTHIPFFTLNNYLQLIGIERCIIISDAISAAGCGPGTFQLGERTVVIGDDGVAYGEDQSHFVGSASTMMNMARNLKTHLQLGDAEIQQLTYLNAERLMNVN